MSLYLRYSPCFAKWGNAIWQREDEQDLLSLILHVVCGVPGKSENRNLVATRSLIAIVHTVLRVEQQAGQGAMLLLNLCLVSVNATRSQPLSIVALTPCICLPTISDSRRRQPSSAVVNPLYPPASRCILYTRKSPSTVFAPIGTEDTKSQAR